MNDALILETKRLRLRKFRPEDTRALTRVLSDPQAMKFYPAPFDEDGVQDWISRNLRRYQDHGHGLWAMVVKSTGELIGDCGCVLQEVDGTREVEIGYHVRRDMWGQGFATEAAAACTEYAFQRLAVARVISMIRPENVPSRRVAEKNGFRCERQVMWHGYEHSIYARHRERRIG
jgi:[ribosomal protein S5]-alanine N-acetyltransferase